MKSKKLLLSILLVASVLFGAALAQAADVKTYTTKLTLTVPKTAANTNYDEAYLLEVPADFTITQAGSGRSRFRTTPPQAKPSARTRR